MGWNSVHSLSTPLFEGIDEGAFVYFVHSYYAELSTKTIATTHYANDFSAAIHHDNPCFLSTVSPETNGIQRVQSA